MSPTRELSTRDLLLNALTVSSGAIDAISFLALGKVFSAFMTGNIAFLGMRVAGAPSPGAVAVLVSMVCFAAGVYVSTRIVRPREGAETWPSPVTVALGISLIAHIAFVGVWLITDGQPPTYTARVLLGLWALAMGIQSAAVRALHVDAVFTTAATATVIYLAGDFSNWPATAVERRRLAGVLASLFVGAAVGALLLIHARLYAPVLPLVITAAVVGTAAVGLRAAPAERSERSRVGGTA